jgi:membrane protein implicated in regulation of membrane protease activity
MGSREGKAINVAEPTLIIVVFLGLAAALYGVFHVAPTTSVWLSFGIMLAVGLLLDVVRKMRRDQ